jgi:hypothetical protein
MRLSPSIPAGVVVLSFALWATQASASSTASMKLDQVNHAAWDKAWTNLVNDVEQSFTPSLPRLLGIEVDLVVANAGPDKDELTLTLMDETGKVLAEVIQMVQTSECDHAMFLFSKEGINVTPGRSYRIRMAGGTLFGWKYVVGGYEKGEATFSGKPLLGKVRGTFLFRTFGAVISRSETPESNGVRQSSWWVARTLRATRELPVPCHRLHSPDLLVPCWA